MTTIHLTTIIEAPIEKVFDLSRNIDVHVQSAASSYEKAIAGIVSGTIGLNETVTWRGKHFGCYLHHKSRITTMEIPYNFTDEMEEGKFKFFRHQHFFKTENGVTIMTDNLEYATPFGIFGYLFNTLILKKHLTKFLLARNETLKNLSER